MALTKALGLPVRVGLRAGERGLEMGLDLLRGARRAVRGDGDSRARAVAADGTTVPVRPDPEPPPPPPRTREPAAPPRRPPADGPTVAAVPPPAGAKTVDDAPVPVAERADAAAADGAGAEVRVDAPWDGYDAMTATEVRARLAEHDSEIAAAVTLYENAHRGRSTVLAAAERRLRETT